MKYKPILQPVVMHISSTVLAAQSSQLKGTSPMSLAVEDGSFLYVSLFLGNFTLVSDIVSMLTYTNP